MGGGAARATPVLPRADPPRRPPRTADSNGAMGKFYEGIMVTGVTSDATDDAVQRNIVAAGYQNIPPRASKPLGCFKDAKDYDLPVCATKRMSSADAVGECSALCATYSYFALENGKECRCGNAYGKHGRAADPADCGMPCGEDPSVMCGGFYYESVYAH